MSDTVSAEAARTISKAQYRELIRIIRQAGKVQRQLDSLHEQALAITGENEEGFTAPLWTFDAVHNESREGDPKAIAAELIEHMKIEVRL